jgi:hypothetical protein
MGDGRPATRAPAVRELLAHRIEILSQKEGMAKATEGKMQ